MPTIATICFDLDSNLVSTGTKKVKGQIYHTTESFNLSTLKSGGNCEITGTRHIRLDVGVDEIKLVVQGQDDVGIIEFHPNIKPNCSPYYQRKVGGMKTNPLGVNKSDVTNDPCNPENFDLLIYVPGNNTRKYWALDPQMKVSVPSKSIIPNRKVAETA